MSPDPQREQIGGVINIASSNIEISSLELSRASLKTYAYSCNGIA
jgi:hypothetical protein